MSQLNIAIIGCGIGGLAMALYLEKTSHKVSLFDQFKRPAPVGSGLVLQPVGQQVLAQIGCLDSVTAKAAPIYSMLGTESKNGKTVLQVEYGAEQGDNFGLGIHRGSLFDVLYQSARKSSATFHHGHVISDAPYDDDKRFIVTSKGETFGPYDLIIDSSGARSKISPIAAKPLEFGALWGTVDWPEDTALPTNRLTQCYKDADKMMGVLPIGSLPNQTKKKATIFWSEPRGTLPTWPQKGLQDWHDEAISLWPEFTPFISQITSPDQMTPATYSHGTLAKPYRVRLAIIGDAAHQASPQLGQGANMALLDAMALYEALVAHDDLDAALIAYHKRRYAHVRLYQIFSAAFTPFYQSHSKTLPWVRNHVMNPMSQIWPIKPMLTRLVCGTLIKP